MADISNLNTISSSKYDIYTKLLDLLAAGEYATAKEEFDDIDFLKSGLFGYVTEATAMSIRDSAFHKMMVYRESFLSSAIIPSSVYSYARMFNINVLDATPSSRYATFSISLGDISAGINNSTSNADDYRSKYGLTGSSFMVIDKSNPIIAGSTYYALEHSLVIYKSGSKYTVRYCTSERDATTSFGTYSTSALTSYVSNNSLYFRARVYQYRTAHSYKTISGSTFMDVKSHKFGYSGGQLCGMRLNYSKGSSSEEVDLEFSNLTTSYSASESKLAYYSLSDDSTVTVDFASNSASGLPQPGGRLDMTMFITDGASGNVAYTGTAIMQLAQDDYKSLAIGVILDENYYTGGTDQSSLQDIKTKIIRQLSTRNAIVTESDMNIWFAAQSELLSDVCQSKITFRKETDDFLKRTYIAELVLRDGVRLTGKLSGSNGGSGVSASYLTGVVPTNTIDVHYRTSGKDSGETITLGQSNRIYYDSSAGIYATGNEGSGSLSYQTPFDIILNKEYNSVSYYYAGASASTALSVNSATTIADGLTMVPDSVSISKTNLDGTNPGYQFVFLFSSDSDLSAMKLSDVTLMIDSTPISLTDSCEFESASDGDDEDSDDSATKSYSITINSTYNGIDNSQVTPKMKLTFDTGSAAVQISSSINIKLQFTAKSGSMTMFSGSVSGNDQLTMFKALDDVMSSDVDIMTSLPGGIYKILRNGTTPYGIELADGTTTYVDSSGKCTIDGDPYTIAISNSGTDVALTINGDACGIGDFSISSEGVIVANKEYVIKSVPVIASYWINSNVNKDWLIKQLNTYIDLLKDNSDKLETSTFFNLKFRNTYGISKRCSSTTTQLRMMMRIYLNSSEALTNTDDADKANSELEDEIREYIRIQVDKSNDLGELIVSKIIMATQAAYYDYINRIDFNGINGTFAQYVRKSDSTEDNNADPLEWFSLDETIEDGKTHLQEDISFEYV